MKASKSEGVAKEFQRVMQQMKEHDSHYDPNKEYLIPKAKVIVTPGTIAKGTAVIYNFPCLQSREL
jgi:hypothetical protein